MFFANKYFYFITIVLQLICVVHCVRRGRQQNNWIWIIVFLPVVGCLAYIFTAAWTLQSAWRCVRWSGIGEVCRAAVLIVQRTALLWLNNSLVILFAAANASLIWRAIHSAVGFVVMAGRWPKPGGRSFCRDQLAPKKVNGSSRMI